MVKIKAKYAPKKKALKFATVRQGGAGGPQVDPRWTPG
jgi:hypothetical protein